MRKGKEGKGRTTVYCSPLPFYNLTTDLGQLKITDMVANPNPKTWP